MNVPNPASRGSALTRQQFLKRGLAAGVAVGPMGALLASCGGDSSSPDGSPASGTDAQPPATPTGTLVLALPAAPVTLDAARRSITGDFTVTQPMYDGLVRWNADFTEVEPALVTDFTASPDGREWTGTLREGVTFHDGTELDSTAVRKALEYYEAAEGFLGPFFLPEFSEIDDSDPAVIRLVTKDPAPDLTNNLTTVAIMSPRSVAAGNKAIERRPVGTGAFRFVERTSTAVVLERNPTYWEEGKPYLEGVRFQVIGDLGARISALQTDEVNAITLVPSVQARQLAADDRVELVANDLWTVTYLAFKLLAEPTDELAVRQAIAHGIDRQAIAESILEGQARPATAFMPEGVYGHQPMQPDYAYDPERARSLVQEAGGGGPVRLGLACPAGDGAINNPKIAQAIAAQLGEVGFEVRVSPLEEGLFSKQAGEPEPRSQAFLIDHPWSNGGPFIFDFLTFSVVANLPEADPAAAERAGTLTTKMQTTPNGDERLAVIGDLQSIFAEQLTYLPLFYFRVPDAVSAKVRGYVVPKDGLGNHRLESVFFS